MNLDVGIMFAHEVGMGSVSTYDVVFNYTADVSTE